MLLCIGAGTVSVACVHAWASVANISAQLCSTLAAVVMTPLLTTQLIGTVVPVDGWALFKSTLQVRALPALHFHTGTLS